MKLKYFIIVFIIIIFLSGCTQTIKNTEPIQNNAPVIKEETKPAQEQIQPKTEQKQELPENKKYVIEITSDGYNPTDLKIKKGDTVTFLNSYSRQRWPATDFHPTHTVYPGSSIKDCKTKTGMFDACHGLKEGETFNSAFNEIGSWSYHDHLKPSLRGNIEVE